MSPSGVILFQDNIVADLFEKDFDQMARVPVVINNQDASLFSSVTVATLCLRKASSLRMCHALPLRSPFLGECHIACEWRVRKKMFTAYMPK